MVSQKFGGPVSPPTKKKKPEEKPRLFHSEAKNMLMGQTGWISKGIAEASAAIVKKFELNYSSCQLILNSERSANKEVISFSLYSRVFGTSANNLICEITVEWADKEDE